MTLNKKEKILMESIYNVAASSGQCILTPTEILKIVPYKYDFRQEDVETTLDALRLEGYFEYDKAFKKDDMVYCIVLKDKGKAYLRDKKVARKNLYIKIIITVSCAVLAYLIKVLVGSIIGK